MNIFKEKGVVLVIIDSIAAILRKSNNQNHLPHKLSSWMIGWLHVRLVGSYSYLVAWFLIG